MENSEVNNKHPNRDDLKYIRIERYYNHELMKAVLYEVLLRLNKADEPSSYNIYQDNDCIYEFEHYDWELYIDILIARIKSDLRKKNLILEPLLLNHVLSNVVKFKSSIISGIEAFVKLQSCSSLEQNRIKHNEFGFLKNNIKNLEDLLVDYSGISNPKAINYFISLFNFPQLVIKPKFSHNELEKLYQFNHKVFMEVDFSFEKTIETNFINETLHDLYSVDKPFADVFILIEQVLSKELYKEQLQNIQYDIKKTNSKQIQEKLADMFFIYDSIQFGLDEDIVIGKRHNTKKPGLLTTYYYEKDCISFLPKTAKEYLTSAQKIVNSISTNLI